MKTIINLDPKENEEFLILIKEHDEIVRKIERIINEIDFFSISCFILSKKHKLFKNIAQNIKLLQTKFLKWKDKATNFCLNPKYAINKEENLHFTSLHYTINLLDMVNSLELNVKKVIDNYNITIERKEAKRNYWIAIISFIVSFLGLIISLVC